MEFVGAGFGDRVDVGAHRVRGRVEIDGGDVVRGDGVRRNRRTGVRQAVGVQAEGIALRQAIDADVVVAAVLARRGDRTVALVGDLDARVEPRDVVDRAVALRVVCSVRPETLVPRPIVVRLNTGDVRVPVTVTASSVPAALPRCASTVATLFSSR